MKGGYVGEYNGNILKSSYEYIFAKILEFKNISYKTEEYTYLLDNGSYYTPDFFIYENNELCEIVEIRGKIKNVKLTLLTEKDLKVLCKEIGLSYNNLKTYWRKNPKNKRNDSSGKANAMYGKKHKESTILILSEKGKMRVKEDPELFKRISSKMVDWCKERNYDHLRGHRKERIIKICESCGTEFVVIDGNEKNKRYCSISCGYKDGVIAAREAVIEKRINRNDILKDFIISWAKEHHELIDNIPYNQITTYLEPLLSLIKDNFSIVDIRTIYRSFDADNRKDFLNKLKSI